MLNKKYIVILSAFLVFAGAYSWYQTNQLKNDSLVNDLEFSTLFYETALCKRAIAEIPCLLQREQFFKNCAEVRCFSKGEASTRSWSEASSEFELPGNLEPNIEDNIKNAVKSFLSHTNQEVINNVKLNKTINVDIKKTNGIPVLQVDCAFSIEKK